MTYIADIDGLASISTGRCVIGKRVWWYGCSGTAVEVRWRSAAVSAAVPTSSSTISTSETAATSIATTTRKTASAAHAKPAATSNEAARGPSEPIFADLQHATLPVIAIELSNSVPCIFGMLVGNNTGALGTTVMS